MNVELTIQSMFDEYPALFKERADCLDHLFVCIGNGYKWKDGELSSSDDKYTKADKNKFKSHLVDGKAFQHNLMSLRQEHIYYHNLRKAEGKTSLLADVYTPEELEEMHLKRVAALPDDVYHTRPRRERWYCHRKDAEGHEYIELSKNYAKLFNYPEDIKPDWKEAIEETKKLLLEDLGDMIKEEDLV